MGFELVNFLMKSADFSLNARQLGAALCSRARPFLPAALAPGAWPEAAAGGAAKTTRAKGTGTGPTHSEAARACGTSAEAAFSPTGATPWALGTIAPVSAIRRDIWFVFGAVSRLGVRDIRQPEQADGTGRQRDDPHSLRHEISIRERPRRT